MCVCEAGAGGGDLYWNIHSGRAAVLLRLFMLCIVTGVRPPPPPSLPPTCKETFLMLPLFVVILFDSLQPQREPTCLTGTISLITVPSDHGNKTRVFFKICTVCFLLFCSSTAFLLVCGAVVVCQANLFAPTIA